MGGGGGGGGGGASRDEPHVGPATRMDPLIPDGVDARSENEEDEMIKCQVCGGAMQAIVTDLPFKLAERAIVIVKDLPVLQCDGCSEYLLEDATLQRIDELLARADASAELEIIRFAA